MNDYSLRNAKTHNTVVAIITIACLGTISGSYALDWEFWVPPLIVVGLIATLVLHLTQYGSRSFRENYYLILTMLISFYHGVHSTSFFEIVVVSSLMMVNVTLLQRREFVALMLTEYFVLLIIQIVLALRFHSMEFDTITVSKIILHVVAECCIYKGLNEVLRNDREDREELEKLKEDKDTARTEMEDFLVNLSHELRTPVNVINGMSTVILKKEEREDVASIRDAGLRLSSQIEDIQDYSEIQRGDVVLEEDRYLIASLLGDVIKDYSLRERNRRIDLVVDLDPNVPAVLRGDAGKIGKVIRHLLDNAAKFTDRGGIFLRVHGIRRPYGINLIIEVTDTGIGMTQADMDGISGGLYQADKSRSRSTGGVGLGLSIVYGFVRKMNGFVNIESTKGKGTTVKVSIAQEIVDPAPCLHVDSKTFISAALYMSEDRERLPEVNESVRRMALDLAAGLRLNLYPAATIDDLKRLMERGDITHVFTGAEEYERSTAYFDGLAADGSVTLAISAPADFAVQPGSRAFVIPDPLYGVPVVRILNGEGHERAESDGEESAKPVLAGIRALVVDDEPLNLTVAVGLFGEYGMIIDTAESGRDAIDRYSEKNYDIVFMDHMMPEMDGVEAMKRIREIALKKARVVRVIALTANAVSGVREMFLREGFDEFISKPVNISEFERIMHRMFPAGSVRQEGGRI
ncbi:MAG: response regulator [Lachnospiraceae bacterium]|nr:response regulator [Lachnospiraceae bacterium]